MKISDLLRLNKPLLSFEFFPPKNSESESVLHETVDALKRFRPDFVSVTYGAGGTTRDRTLQWTLDIRERYGLNVMMHLTCIASSKEDLEEIMAVLHEAGVRNVLALRGDLPADLEPGKVRENFCHASELVDHLRRRNDFSIGVAGYPEGHQESGSLEEDILFLKRKVDAGADFIITQIFFENRYFFDFVERARGAGIEVPVIPGIMPIVNLGQVRRFTQMCGATVPDEIVRRMEGKNPDEAFRIGVDHAVKQCVDLLDNDVAGLHFYTLNRNQATGVILDRIGSRMGR